MTDGPRACPRTGRSRALPLPPGGVRPSDMLVAFFALDPNCIRVVDQAGNIYEGRAGGMGKPVVASGLPMIERTFPPGTVAAYAPGDPDAMAF